MSNKLQVWARLGVYIEVDELEFKNDAKGALRDAVKKGKYKENGDRYVPDSAMEDLFNEGKITEDQIEELDF